MRDIKFRAWDKDRKKYRYYDLSSVVDAQSYFLLISDPYVKLKDLIREQFTGLKDKNGKEIYEGDVVKYIVDDEDSCCGNQFEYICTVSFGNSLGLSRYVAQYPQSFCLINKEFYKEQALFGGRGESGTYEVIGNIHE